MNPFFLPATEAMLEETTYRIDPVHGQLAVGAIGALAVLFVAFLLDARRRPGALAHPAALACVAPHVGLVAFVVVMRDMPYFQLFGSDGPWNAATMFRGAAHLYGATAAVAAAIFVATLLVLALRRGSRLPLLRTALPTLVLAGLAAARFSVAAGALVTVGQVPFYVTTGDPVMHVGRERDVPVVLSRPPSPYWFFGRENGPQPVDAERAAAWSAVTAVRVRAAGKGRVAFDAVAHRGPVTATSHLSARAAAERSSPLLSLRVGDKLHYRVQARSSDGTALYFITLAGSESVHEVTIEVAGTRDRDGLRTFVLAIRHAERTDEVEVVALDGETRVFYPAQHKVGPPVVAFAEGADASAADPVPCSFALLDAAQALCQRVRFAAAAPVTFARDTTGSGSTIATAFVAIVTIGLVILPDGSSTASYTLVSTERGAEGAAEALPDGDGAR